MIKRIRKLKVLYVHHCPERGGASTSLKNLILSLMENDVDPLVLSPEGPSLNMFRQHGIPCASIPRVPEFFSMAGAPMRGLRLILIPRAIRQSWSQKQLKKQIVKFRPDIVHINERSLILTAKLASKLGCTVVMHARNVASHDVKWAHEVGKYYIRKYVDALVCIDESVRRSLSDAKESFVVYNSVINSKSLPVPTKGSGDSPVRFVFLSSLIAYKGVWDLLEAAKLLSERREFNLQILGANSRPSEFFQSVTGKIARCFHLVRELDKEMIEFIKNNGLETKVQLRGFIDDFDDFLAEVDVNVFPSHLNGPSRSVFETGVKGIPTILALKNKVEDVVVDGGTGLIVPQGDPVALASAMQRLIDDRKLRLQLGEAAAKKYVKQFDASRSAKAMTSIYKSLVS